METIEFSTTKNMGKIYADLYNRLILRGHQFGLVDIKEDLSFTAGNKTYTVSPIGASKLVEINGFLTHPLTITVTDKNSGERAKDKHVNRDVVAALCLLNGSTAAIVNGSKVWVLNTTKKRIFITLAKYVGIAVACIVVAGLVYYTFAE